MRKKRTPKRERRCCDGAHVQLGALADPLGDHLGLEALVREVEHVGPDQNAAGLSALPVRRAGRLALPLGRAARRYVQEHRRASQLQRLQTRVGALSLHSPDWLQEGSE